MGRVSGKVAIVTGAAGGMGKEDALLLAKEGAKVVVTDIQEEKVNEVVAQINQSGGEAIGFRHDVTSEEEWIRIIDETVKKWGKIDVLVNNAGISLAKSLVDTTAQDWDKVMSINLTGGFFGIKHVIPVMQKNGGRLDHQHFLHRRLDRQQRRRSIHGKQRCGPFVDEGDCDRLRQRQHPVQLDSPGLYRNADDQRPARRRSDDEMVFVQHAAGPLGQSGKHRGRRPVPGFRRIFFYYGRGIGYRRRRIREIITFRFHATALRENSRGAFLCRLQLSRWWNR